MRCESGSAWIRNFCLDMDLDPQLLFQIRIRIQQNMKKQVNKILFLILGLGILDCVYCRTVL